MWPFTAGGDQKRPVQADWTQEGTVHLKEGNQVEWDDEEEEGKISMIG